MKVAIFKNSKQMQELRRIGRKVVSHGSLREKRKPNSKRVRTARKQTQYKTA